MENVENFKSIIEKLYCKEGRSLSYIANLIDLPRTDIKHKIEEWQFVQGNSDYLKPSILKHFNQNKSNIINWLKNDAEIEDICVNLNCSKKEFHAYTANDSYVKQIYSEYLGRLTKNKKCVALSNHLFKVVDLPNEIWKEVDDYPTYYISNMGRVKKYSTEYKKYYLLDIAENKDNHRLYVNLINENGRRYIQVSRLVGDAFIPGKSEENDTINHIDCNIHNNKADNLEWVSQVINTQKYFKDFYTPRSIILHKYTILYKDKFTFKSVASFAKFIGKSETQTYRIINKGSSDIKIIDRKTWNKKFR